MCLCVRVSVRLCLLFFCCRFAKNPFFLTSESYGGHYLPTLAKSLVDAADVPNFKGFAVGNPLTYMEYRNFGKGLRLVAGVRARWPFSRCLSSNECSPVRYRSVRHVCRSPIGAGAHFRKVRVCRMPVPGACNSLVVDPRFIDDC